MSPAKAAVTRANGAAQNSTAHGLNSATVVLANESREEYAALLADYLARYAPAGLAESDLVHEIAATRWRLRRILRIETSLFDRQIEAALESASDEADAQASAFEALTRNSKPLAALGRYENRLRRSYEKALAELKTLQTARKASEEADGQNEPEPRVRRLVAVSASTPPSPIAQNEPNIAGTHPLHGEVDSPGCK